MIRAQTTGVPRELFTCQIAGLKIDTCSGLPYPVELAERLVRMFSFVGDTVLAPFMGTGTTNIAAARWGRNSIGVEVDQEYFTLAANRIEADTPKLLATRAIHLHQDSHA